MRLRQNKSPCYWFCWYTVAFCLHSASSSAVTLLLPLSALHLHCQLSCLHFLTFCLKFWYKCLPWVSLFLSLFSFFFFFFWKTSVPALTVEALSEGSVTWCCYRAADRSVQPHWVFRALQATWLDTHNKGKSIDHRDESCHSGFFLVHYNDFLQTPGEKKLSQF